jgi:hypothetical protein
MSGCSRVVPAVLLFVLVASSLPASVVEAEEAEPPYSAPVDGIVVDPFRLPDGPYGAGNRGIDYETAVGAMVRSAAAGQVVFAGQVAGSLHVTVLHPDGLRTSYSFLAGVQVDVGQGIDQGQILGSSTGRFHFGARAGEDYIDPMLLLASAPIGVRLVPLEGRPGPSGSGGVAELAALVRVVRDRAIPAGSLVGLVGQRVPPALHYLTELSPVTVIGDLVADLRADWPGRQPCTDAATPVNMAAERRIVVLVGGIGSTSLDASIEELDTEALGYGDRDVVRFSYLGGVVGGPGDVGLAVTSYRAVDTTGDLGLVADLLAELLGEIAAAHPGVPIDVVAHSQGGVVAHAALVSRPPPQEVGLVATLGAPHAGTDLATAIAAVRTRPGADQALDLLGRALGQPLDPASTSVGQLSETSILVSELGDRSLPAGIAYLAIAARGDLIVPSPHSRVSGVRHTVVDLVGPTAHADLPGDEAVTRELLLALDGRWPTCRSALTVLADTGWGRGLAWAQDLLGAAAWDLAG